VSDGWFVVNLRDAAWLTNDAFRSQMRLRRRHAGPSR